VRDSFDFSRLAFLSETTIGNKKKKKKKKKNKEIIEAKQKSMN
jgi:hypothetical protein